jgi:hypothetical protein
MTRCPVERYTSFGDQPPDTSTSASRQLPSMRVVTRSSSSFGGQLPSVAPGAFEQSEHQVQHQALPSHRLSRVSALEDHAIPGRGDPSGATLDEPVWLSDRFVRDAAHRKASLDEWA